jgi:hypothetical protein
VILGHHQGDREGVASTYALPGDTVGVHRGQRLQREPNFTQRNLGRGDTPAHRFFQISQSPFPFQPTGYNGE